MLPGLAHFHYGAGSLPPLEVEVTPAPASWTGTAPNFTTSLSAIVTGGPGPFTYTWSAPGALISSGQGTANVSLTSTSGFSVSVTVSVLSAGGQVGVGEGSVVP